MCGNGVRCFAKYVVDHGLVPPMPTTVRVETASAAIADRGDAGLRRHRSTSRRSTWASPSCARPTSRPRCGAAPTRTWSSAARSRPTWARSRSRRVSMGNPHCVLWVDDVDDAPVDVVGPVIENHACSRTRPTSSSLELVDDMRFACASGSAAWARRSRAARAPARPPSPPSLALRIGREATVELPGGELAISWAEDDHVYMTGPATEVFSGTRDHRRGRRLKPFAARFRTRLHSCNLRPETSATMTRTRPPGRVEDVRSTM